jgi:hypothetical protein
MNAPKNIQRRVAAWRANRRVTPVWPTTEDGYDIGAIAEQVGQVLVPYVDDRMLVDNQLVDLENTRAREHAARLSTAAGHAATQRAQRAAGSHAARAAELRIELEQREAESVAITRDVVQSTALLEALHTTRDNALPRVAKALSFAAKPIMVVGDSALLGNQWYGAGSPLPLALSMGLSAAGGAVYAGTVAGQRAAVAYQRRARGPVPEDCTPGLEDLYDTADQSAGGQARAWLVGALGVGIVLGSAVTGVGLGNNLTLVEAIGTGALAALTVAGSGFAEAYGTNAAATRMVKQEQRRAKAIAQNQKLAEIHGEAAREHTMALVELAAGSSEAMAAAQTTLVISDQTDPKVFGYGSPMPAGASDVAIAPVPQPQAFPAAANVIVEPTDEVARARRRRLTAFADMSIPGGTAPDAVSDPPGTGTADL